MTRTAQARTRSGLCARDMGFRAALRPARDDRRQGCRNCDVDGWYAQCRAIAGHRRPRSASPVPARETRTTSQDTRSPRVCSDLSGANTPFGQRKAATLRSVTGLTGLRGRRSVEVDSWVSTPRSPGSGLRPAHPPGRDADRPPTPPGPAHPREAEPLQPLVFAERGTSPILRPKGAQNHGPFRRAIGPPFGRSLVSRPPAHARACPPGGATTGRRPRAIAPDHCSVSAPLRRRTESQSSGPSPGVAHFFKHHRSAGGSRLC